VPRWRIEPAIDLSLFRPPSVRREPGKVLKLITINRLAWQKGYEFAIDAAARLRELGVAFEYAIYGDGPYDLAVRYAIRHYGLEGQVTLHPSVPRERIPELLAKADVMLHAAIEEGFCNAVIEAQAMELPVVTSDAGGLPENVEDGVTGFVVPRRDPRALAERVAQLAVDPALRDRMGTAGRRRALELFDLERQADAFVAMYRELVA
jgi:colanic acid/amylovoran biosynthesis glycosyltransferase